MKLHMDSKKEPQDTHQFSPKWFKKENNHHHLHSGTNSSWNTTCLLSLAEHATFCENMKEEPVMSTVKKKDEDKHSFVF